MRLFLELHENVPEDKEVIMIGGMVRIPITSTKDCPVLVKKLKDILPLSQYKARLHHCYHEEGKPCKLTKLDISKLKV